MMCWGLAFYALSAIEQIPEPNVPYEETIEPVFISKSDLIKALNSTQTLKIIMAGDALLHTGVFKDAESKSLKPDTFPSYDFTKMLTLIAPIIKHYDLAFYNQETILGGKELGLSSYPTFNSPQEFGDNMLKLGFNMVSLANNHTLDKGERGVRAMLNFWHKKEIENPDLCIAGSYSSFEDRAKPRIFKKNGITYAMLAYTYGTNGIPIPKGKEYLVNVYTKSMLKQDIQELRPKVDLLIVSMHWGIEYDFNPSKEQKELAHLLASLGVDIVIGNHPHVIQPIEWIGKTLVIYSLGNFISAQKDTKKRIGMLAGIDIIKKNNTIELKNLRAELIYTYYNAQMRDFKIYPFKKINDKILPNSKEIYKKYLNIISGVNARL